MTQRNDLDLLLRWREEVSSASKGQMVRGHSISGICLPKPNIRDSLGSQREFEASVLWMADLAEYLNIVMVNRVGCKSESVSRT